VWDEPLELELELLELLELDEPDELLLLEGILYYITR
jgi:hypothetical protein